ncbi:Isochorismatase-like protein [Cryomyces antarcticus]
MQAPSRKLADETVAPAPNRRAVIGIASNFWLHSSKTGFDLTHPPNPSSKPSSARLQLETTTTPIAIDPAKTALVIVDMQNFFLSEAFGRAKGAGHRATDALMDYGIPAARKAGIQVIWLNWGLNDADIKNMPPAVKRAFGFEAVVDDEGHTTGVDDFSEKEHGMGVDMDGSSEHQGGDKMLENGKDGRIYKGLGASCGRLTTPEGETVDGGRLLMADSWNAALYPPLDAAYEEGAKLDSRPDVWIHKNRMSGMWGATSPCQEFLDEKGIRTLLFTGVNTDQCVGGTFTDAFSKGYDCVLLQDGCGTTSPQFATDCIVFNAARTWGFVTTCEALAKGAEEMGWHGKMEKAS